VRHQSVDLAIGGGLIWQHTIFLGLPPGSEAKKDGGRS